MILKVRDDFSSSSDRSLADHFASIFTQKIKRIHDIFPISPSSVIPPMDPPPPPPPPPPPRLTSVMSQRDILDYQKFTHKIMSF